MRTYEIWLNGMLLSFGRTDAENNEADVLAMVREANIIAHEDKLTIKFI